MGKTINVKGGRSQLVCALPVLTVSLFAKTLNNPISSQDLPPSLFSHLYFDLFFPPDLHCSFSVISSGGSSLFPFNRRHVVSDSSNKSPSGDAAETPSWSLLSDSSTSYSTSSTPKVAAADTIPDSHAKAAPSSLENQKSDSEHRGTRGANDQ